jgi:LAO/AO transport system kinase
MEIADVFAVNKADRDGVERVVAEIESMLSLAPSGRRPEIVKTVATADRGVAELLEAVGRFRADARSSGLLARRRRDDLRRRLEQAVGERLMRHARARVLTAAETERLVDLMEARRLDPFGAADDVVRRTGL